MQIRLAISLGFVALIGCGIVAASSHSLRIGQLDFFGLGGLNVSRVRSAIPFKEGAPVTMDAFPKKIDAIKKAVTESTGKPATDVEAVCCDSQGDWIVYVGLPGSTSKTPMYNPVPSAPVMLPKGGTELADRYMTAMLLSVEKRHGAEDDSHGYALSGDPVLRRVQTDSRSYAVLHCTEIRRVLAESADAEQRRAAALLLGYCDRSKEQLAALAAGARDSDDGVRNNATRALGVIAVADKQARTEIPFAGFVAMLASGVWTDRNKACMLLGLLSEPRSGDLISSLKQHAIKPLTEMARWQDPGHSYWARLILGRVGGIPEERLQKLLTHGDLDTILKSLPTSNA